MYYTNKKKIFSSNLKNTGFLKEFDRFFEENLFNKFNGLQTIFKKPSKNVCVFRNMNCIMNLAGNYTAKKEIKTMKKLTVRLNGLSFFEIPETLKYLFPDIREFTTFETYRIMSGDHGIECEGTRGSYIFVEWEWLADLEDLLEDDLGKDWRLYNFQVPGKD